jgi:tetratricopeptide (TPR) repeat protein
LSGFGCAGELKRGPSETGRLPDIRARNAACFKRSFPASGTLPEAAEELKLAPRRNVTRALAEYASPRDLAKSLKVRFLIRGSVVRAPSAYNVTLSALDGESEQVLGTASLSIPAGALTPSSHEQIDEAFRSVLNPCIESEVARARAKPDATLDARDLTFRAESDWYHKRMYGDEKGAYVEAQQLLKRALALAPDNPSALRATVNVNLCECNHAWSSNFAEQQAIGEAALDRFLSVHPEDVLMLQDKASLYELRDRYPEALAVLDFTLSRHPENSDLMREKAFVLLRLGRPNEAAALATAAYAVHPNRWGRSELLAAVNYELADYAAAEQFAQMAITKMSKTDLRDSNSGTVRLTLIAAAAHIHDEAVKNAALSDLRTAVPELTSLGAIRKWMSPQSSLYHYEPLLDGLRLAGFHD